jgi:hypothetical protein
MAKFINDTVLDAALNDIKNNANEMTVCSAQPTTYTESHTTFMLATVAMASGDYTVANGDTSGRKVTTAAKTGTSISASGTATHVALNDTTSSALKAVTTCTSQALSVGGTVDVPGWKYEINDPS